MKTITLVAALAFAPLMGFALPACQSSVTQEQATKAYIEADQATYEAIAPELEQWLAEEDPQDQDVQEAQAALTVWKNRIDSAESYPWIAYVASDRNTYDIIAPIYERLMFKHIDDPEAQARRLRTLQTWDLRIKRQEQNTEAVNA